MSGAPITVTLYQNGIHVTYGHPEFFQSKELERLMREAFDRGEDVERLLWDGPLAKILDRVQVAIDCMYVEDKRGEVYAATRTP